MIKKLFHTILIVCSTLVLTSCWDQELLKESKLVYGAGFDYEENNLIRTTFVVRNLGIPVSQGGVYSNRVVSVVGSSSRDTRLQMDRIISKQLSASKNQLLLLGEEVAKHNIDHMLDILFRDPKSPLDARIAVVEGRALDMYKLDHIGDTLITEFTTDLIKGAEDKTEATKMTVEKAFRYSLDEGQDYALPYISYNQEVQSPEFDGLALFHHTTFTGATLSPMESKLLLLMNDNKSSQTNIIEALDNDPDNGFLTNTVTISVRKSSPDMAYSFQNGKLDKAVINLEIIGNIAEYPQNHLMERSQVKDIADELSQRLTVRANDILQKLQEANCDFLGIGRDMNAYHHKVWNSERWEDEYKEIKLEAKVKVEIDETGIIK
ncbi:Ger(x)C family spore germination protein [Pseudalkalibacillus hwajinpoensis]|uniref:Ger(X)C family spore germination protein n=1 Tax=Guptibacillus hwajinpoensis TaxID=208199 RepID=A0A4U1MDS8_9BACL|nr:Ger(x)C family spore germination protein [Pseudalkalibacillus hwajinpoensis]TKD68791.1 Ger(x)C family spore germination protein [Pseudalkalibacillus hwajinpoensis]